MLPIIIILLAIIIFMILISKNYNNVSYFKKDTRNMYQDIDSAVIKHKYNIM